jgi:hypothetical protein
MPFTDFKNGLSSVDQYLSAQHHTRLDLQGSVADIGRFIVHADYSTSLKEIICSLLAGQGLKLPNIQLCIFLNLQELLGLPNLQAILRDALEQLSAAMQRFLDHTRIGDVLSRINNALAEITNIANMINFCSAPIDPVAIPNLLEQGMQSFLGKGQELINKIGQMVPGEIGGCLTPGSFNANAFESGLLGRIGDNFSAVSTGTASNEFVEAVIADVNSIVNEIDTLISDETAVSGSYDDGGSEFSEGALPINDTIGVLHNSADAGIQGNTNIAGQLKALYDNLGSYQVVGTDGTVYNNIFETFVEPDLLRLLRRQDDPRPRIATRQPVYNYCGEVTGYTESVVQEQSSASTGTIPSENDQPGFNAGGLPTTDQIAAGDGTSSSIELVNQITNVTGTVQFADSEAAMLSYDLTQGIIVNRTDTGETFVKNSGTSGTSADFNQIGSTNTGTSIGTFLTNVDNGSGTGMLVRDGDTALYRTIQGTANQISITNGNGQGSNPTVGLVDNPIMPGTGALRLPTGITGDRINVNGNMRYNTQTAAFEGYANGTWQNFAFGTGTITDGANIGGAGIEVFNQVNGSALEFRTFNASGAIVLTAVNNVITVSENLTVSNLGSGAHLASRAANDVQVKSIVAGKGVDISSSSTAVTISTDVPVFNQTASTTDASIVTIPFAGITPASGRAWYVEVQATAKRTNGAGVTSIKLEGIVDNSSGTVSIAGTAGNRTVYNSIPSTANYDLVLSTPANSAFQVGVQGDAGHNVNWAVKITYHEV